MREEWDDEADVVVVGYGGAGAAAAITAADLGASVLIVEKQAEHRHTPSTRLSGGLMMGVNDADKATRYLDACAGGLIPEPVSRMWAERAATVIDWLIALDPSLEFVNIGGPQHPEFEGADGVDVYLPHRTSGGNSQRGSGEELYAALKSGVDRRPSIRVAWESPAHRLVRDGDRIVGLQMDGGQRRIKAGKGVVLTCGGYEFDEELKANFLKAHPIYFYGNPGNTGDGVRMAQDVGAALWHMNQMVGRAIGHFDLDDGAPLNVVVSINPPPYVMTDKFGLRFTNEQVQADMKHVVYYDLIKFDPDRHDYPRIPCYWFFDERRLTAGPIVLGGGTRAGLYDWSDDNQVEIDRGWIARGDTVEEAAAAAGVLDPKAAARTVREYNELCSGGEDPFGRAPETLVALDQPPYYCMPMWPGGPNTCGGPRRNERGEVIGVFGDPIPGLYAAGELGQPIGRLYPSRGADLCDALCAGQVAAEALLKES